uniref:Selenium-binding protein-like n=3 Tax=Oryza sativa subsp. japonica TaxID=39947 RepID=Q7XHM3_ORYSJ|nr:selenium-binding protein-like [Oryza sativa Japonica Group]
MEKQAAAVVVVSGKATDPVRGGLKQIRRGRGCDKFVAAVVGLAAAPTDDGDGGANKTWRPAAVLLELPCTARSQQERSGGGILELMEQEIGGGGAGDLLRRQSSSTSLAFPSVRTAGEPKLKVRLSCRLQELYLLHEIELASELELLGDVEFGGGDGAWGRVWLRRDPPLLRGAASSTAIAALLAGDCVERLPPMTASATLAAPQPSQPLHIATAAVAATLAAAPCRLQPGTGGAPPGSRNRSMRPLPPAVAARLAAVRADPAAVPLPFFNSLLSALASSHAHLPLHLFRRLLLPRRRPDAFTLSSLAASLLPPAHSPSASVTAAAAAAGCLHAFSLRLGLLRADPVLANSFLLLYLRAASPGLARRLFDEMPARTASTYNTLISHSPPGVDVWPVVRHMVEDGCVPDRFTVSSILPACESELRGRELHCFALKSGMCGAGDFHVGSSLVSMYFRVGQPGHARRVFDGMEQRNVVSWTAMVGGFTESGMFEDAVDAFRAMWVIGAVLPNRIALISVLSAVEALTDLAAGKQVHGFAVRMGLSGEVSLNNALIVMYVKCGVLWYARQIFDDGRWCKDVISWCSMIQGYGLHGKGAEAVALFDQMHISGVKPDSITGLGVLSACSRAGLVFKGLEIYNSLVKDYGVHPTEEMSACIVDLLGRSGMINQALDFIKSMSIEPGPSVWGALLDASIVHNNKEIQDLSCRYLLRLEEGNPSNLVSVSNLHAFDGSWNIVEHVRAKIKQGALKKIPGFSWINPT